MSVYPEITTERLLLNELQYLDIPNIVEYADHEKVVAITLNMPHPYKEKDAIFWINSANQGLADKTQYTFAIRIKSTYEFIGGVGLKANRRFNRAELGYWVAVPFWNKGYATEAVEQVLKFGFETLKMNKIYALFTFENPASGKVMEKNGMIKEGELIDHYKKGEVYNSVVQMRLTNREYKKQ